MAHSTGRTTSRRGLLKHLAAGGALGSATLAWWAGCRRRRAPEEPHETALRAAFSTAGLRATWNRAGRQAAYLWGELLGVEIHWFDGQFDADKQREQLEKMAAEDWDFCAVQAHQIGVLEDAVRKLKKRSIPVLAIDTLLVEKSRMREVGVWLYLGPNHRQMAVTATRYLVDRIGRRGKVIHIGGQSGHSGAQERLKGFNEVIAECPEIEVVGGGARWCNWDPEVARETFKSLLQLSEEPIAGAFFHNDDMALAGIPELEGTRHEGMVVTSIDGQEPGLRAVREGKLGATVVNPACMIHGWAVAIGRFIVQNQEKLDDVPLEIICPSQLVASETGNVDAMLYLSNAQHGLM